MESQKLRGARGVGTLFEHGSLRDFTRLNYDLDHWRNSLAIIGLPISVGAGIYTGVLLGAVQSRPFWNTNLVAQLFLFPASRPDARH